MQHLTHSGAFLSCDWGTSSFRLQLFDPVHNITVAEEISDEGCAVIFNKWQQQKGLTDRSACYLSYLKEMIRKISHKTGLALDDSIVVISGMAGSSIGMQELPYAILPFPTDGSAAIFRWISDKELIHNKVLLLSGVASDKDLMRGEETQLTGIVNMVKFEQRCESIYIFPGTHSKHVAVVDGKIVDIKTFMTGELFGLLVRHGLLSSAVTVPEENGKDAKAIAAFYSGIENAIQADLVQTLFSVRIRDLKKSQSKTLNYFYLSGLLIGAELKHLHTDKNNVHYVICGAHKLAWLYDAAFQFFRLSDRTTLLADELSRNAAAVGQSVILQNIKPLTDHL